ncbi:hypothetical protein [Streptomyces venezuelae]|uniref:hypothetical protein n=1 Tax=Streptomyces venezuelae TaxID=54571 RepID=UPI003331561E
MKLKRIAVVAAAAVVGPTVLMATPAMADEVRNPAVTTPDAEPKGDAAGDQTPAGTGKPAETPAETGKPAEKPAAAPAKAPAKAAAKAASQAQAGPELSIFSQPQAFAAGGDWAEFNVSIDNTGNEAVQGFDLGLNFLGTDVKLSGKHIELEYQSGNGWTAVPQMPGLDAPHFDLVAGATIGKNAGKTVRVRARASADAPATAVTITATGTNHTSVDSKPFSRQSKITRAGEQVQSQAPVLSLTGLPEWGFKAGDDVGTELTLKVDNSARPGTGEYYLGVDLVSADTSLRADQVVVEYYATTVNGESFWHPVEVSGDNGKLRIFDYGGEYAAGEQRNLVFRVRLAADVPAGDVKLTVSGQGNPHHGGLVSKTVSYSSSIEAASAPVDVEGPKMTLTGIPAGGFKAGADWQELALTLDNAGLAGIEDYLVSFHMGRGFDQGPWVEPSQIHLQAFGEDEHGKEGWFDIEIGGSEESMGGDIGLQSIAAGDKAVVKLRLRFDKGTPAGGFMMGASGYKEQESGPFVWSSTGAHSTRILAADSGNGGGNGNGNGGGTGNQPKPDGGTTTPVVDGNGNGNGAGNGTGTGTGTAPTTGGALAETGSDAATSWALGSAGVALAMGAALVAGTGRRRRPTA